MYSEFSMESMSVSFVRDYSLAVQSWLAFLHSLGSYKRSMLFLFLIVWSLFAGLDLYLPHPFLGIEISWAIPSLIVLSQAIKVLSVIIFCIIPAVIVVGLTIIAQDRAAIKSIDRLPAEAFGSTVVTISPVGLSVHAPHAKADYDWINPLALRVTTKYVYIVSSKYLITSIPISAFGTRLTEFIQKFQSWRAEYQQAK